jgi:predicted Zn-dependent protease
MLQPTMRAWLRNLTYAALGLSASAPAGCRTRPGDAPDEHVWGGGRRGTPKIVMGRAKAGKGEPQEVLAILEHELAANLAALSAEDLELPAYYLGYSLVEIEELYVEAEGGALIRDELETERLLDVDVRVGSRKLDNSHSQGGDYGPGNGLGSGLSVSLEDEPLSLSQSIWLDTEEQYKAAVAKLRDVESSEQLRSEIDDHGHPDFSEEKPLVHYEPSTEVDLAAIRADWSPRIARLSARFDGAEAVLRSAVTFVVRAENRYMVNSDKTRVQAGTARLRVLMEVQGQAEDGMLLHRSRTFEAHTAEQLPTDEELDAAADLLAEELTALRAAPIAEPYTGPAVLEGRAAGVFFHEIFGHRLEGHRQKDDVEGQTFTDKLGKRVLPKFLDVVDDPTVSTLGGAPLSGHYFVDDEGVGSRRAVLVERGKLKGFLLGRSPVLPFQHSNGHGRREPGYQTVARQGNLIVTSRRALTRKQLRQALIDEIERQGKPYGLWFSDIEGGYTITDRSGPQAFKVEPLMVYRVYADGRPDELVRGVEIVGTPLAAFETIVATDDQPGIFNGMCGAESGWVPVSAVSPSLLLKQLEIERAAHDREKPPLLPPPPAGAAAPTKEGK